MSSTSTTWTTQATTTRRGSSATTTDSLSIGTLTADTIQLNSNVIKASDGGNTITLDASDNVTIAGDLTISGGNITNALALDSTLSVASLLTATSGVKLGNNIIYASDGDAAITTDTSSNVTIAGDLTVTGNDIKNSAGDATITMDGSSNVSIAGDLTVVGGDIDLSGEASAITLIDNTSAAFQIGSTGKTDLFQISTSDAQEVVTIDADRGNGGTALGALMLKGTTTVSGSTGSDSNLAGIKIVAPNYINTSGTNTLARHNYISIEDINITNSSGSVTVTDVCLLELENNLNTSGSCTTNSDKTGNAKSGTIKINVNGTIYHLQLYAN